VIIAVELQLANEHEEELDLQARRLREDLLLLHLDSVTLGRDVSEPDGSKGDPVAIGTLVMTLGNSAVLVAVCQVVRAWVTRGRARHATLKYGKNRTLDITGTTTEQQQQLIEAFIATIKRDIETTAAPLPRPRPDGSDR
jgi:ATP-dependent Zn protease